MKCASLFLLLLLSITIGYAAAPDTTGTTAKANTPPPAVDSTPRILSVSVFHSGFADSSESVRQDNHYTAYAGDILSFKISWPEVFLRTKPTDQTKVALYINGIEMTGITADWNSQVKTTAIQAHTLPCIHKEETINITLCRDEYSQVSWNYLYEAMENFWDSRFYAANVSLGWEHMSALDQGGSDNPIMIAFYKPWEFYSWFALYVGVLCFFLFLAYRTDILRAGAGGPYSLSNSQLLFWTALIIGAFIYTFLLTDVANSFNSSILGILGISISTTGIATMIDQSKVSRGIATRKNTGGFLKDLLTDGDSYSVQRVQTFVWNIILGLYFIFYTIKNKTMPTFSSTLLLLAGFSSSSYLGGKLSENTKTADDAKKVQTGG